MSRPAIILASQSPRRKFILQKLGLTFDVIPSNFEEYFDDSLSVDKLVNELGLQKALSVAKQRPDAIVIGGDSIVVLDGKQLGKPEDSSEAKSRLREYRNRSHQVVTSVAVVCLSKKYQRVDCSFSTIYFGDYSDQFIDEYVATGNPMDKAGSYALQHPMIRNVIKKVNGRIDSVIGLDTEILARLLKPLGVRITPLRLDWNKPPQDVGFFE